MEEEAEALSQRFLSLKWSTNWLKVDTAMLQVTQSMQASSGNDIIDKAEEGQTEAAAMLRDNSLIKEKFLSAVKKTIVYSACGVISNFLTLIVLITLVAVGVFNPYIAITTALPVMCIALYSLVLYVHRQKLHYFETHLKRDEQVFTAPSVH